MTNKQIAIIYSIAFAALVITGCVVWFGALTIKPFWLAAVTSYLASEGAAKLTVQALDRWAK